MCMNTKRHVCGICVKLKSLLKTHYRQVYGASLPLDIPGPYYIKPGCLSSANFSCLICKKRFRFRSSLESHLRNHSSLETDIEIKKEVERKGYADDSIGECGVIVSERDEKPLISDHEERNGTNHHANIETSEQDGVISDSDQTIPDTTNYGNSFEEILDTYPNEYRPTCTYCSEEFETNELLTKHLQEAHRSELSKKELPKKNKCGYCKFETFYKHALKLHIERKHPKFTESSEQGGTQCFSCIFCQEVFTVKRHLREHLKSAHKKRWKKSYLNILPDENIEPNVVPEASQENIETKVEPEKPKEKNKRSENKDTCPICNKLCRNRKAMRDHTRTVHNVLWTTLNPKLPSDDRHPCPVCKKEYSKKSLRDHLNKVHKIFARKPKVESADGANYPCSVCGEVYLDERAVRDHTRTVHNVLWTTLNPKLPSDDRHPCPVCKKEYSKKGLRDHLNRKHKIYARKPKVESADGESYPCSICGKEYQDKKAVWYHTRTVHKVFRTPNPKPKSDERYPCPVCKKEYSKKSLRDHLNRVHKIYSRPRKVESAEGENFSCNVCRKVYQDKKGLQAHLKEMHQIFLRHCADGFACPLCPRRFKSVKSVRDHARSFHNRPWSSFDDEVKETVMKSSNLPISGVKPPPQTPSVCKVCSRPFKQKAYLRVHMRTHTGERPLACEICGKRFSGHGTLVHHLRWHRGEKPHKCTHCDRRFNSITSRKKHIMTHTREYNYSCHICGKRFLLQNQLAMHLKYHSGVRNHKCDQCDKAFVFAYLLKKHYRVHTGERPYVCDACGVAYRWRFNFVHHLKAKHPKLMQQNKLATSGDYIDTTKEQTWIRYVTPDAQGSTEWYSSSANRSRTESTGYMDQSGTDSKNQVYVDLMGGASVKGEETSGQAEALNQVPLLDLPLPNSENILN